MSAALFPILSKWISKSEDFALPLTHGSPSLLGTCRPPTLRHPAKDDGCSMIWVPSTIWNRCARGSRLLRSSTGPPSTRALCEVPFVRREELLRIRRGRTFCTTRFCPASTAPSSALFWRGPFQSTASTFSPVDFLEEVETASCGSVAPDFERRMLVFLSRSLPPCELPHLRVGTTAAPETASTIASARGN